MSEFGQFFVFENGSLISALDSHLEAGTDAKLAAADSWLIEDGRARNMPKHFERFADWVGELAPELFTDIETFFDEVVAKIPREGRWFPRIELHTSDEVHLRLRLREAPAKTDSVVLWTYAEADVRENPRIKGPDLAYGMQLRRAAQLRGADEAVILSNDGFVAEGALSSLVWWRGDVLCSSSDEIPWLPSVTRDEVFAIAEQMGLQTRTEKIKPADLVGLEVWCLSSLQGIRLAESWIDLGGPLGPARHLDAFNKRMRMLTTSID